MRALFGAVLCLAAASAFADSYVIDDFRFSWTVADAGNASVVIEKHNGDAKVIVRKKWRISSESLHLPPPQAERLGSLLARAGSYYTRQRDLGRETQESVGLGGYRVVFSTTRDFGFRVKVEEVGGFAMSSLSLDRNEAVQLGQALRGVTDKARYLERYLKAKTGDCPS